MQCLKIRCDEKSENFGKIFGICLRRPAASILCPVTPVPPSAAVHCIALAPAGGGTGS
jgi:hypothetical protein